MLLLMAGHDCYQMAFTMFTSSNTNVSEECCAQDLIEVMYLIKQVPTSAVNLLNLVLLVIRDLTV